MGEIIAFPANAKPAEAARTPPHEGEARILFFLGVRYLRFDDATTTTDAPHERGGEAGRGKKRKRRA